MRELGDGEHVNEQLNDTNIQEWGPIQSRY